MYKNIFLLLNKNIYLLYMNINNENDYIFGFKCTTSKIEHLNNIQNDNEEYQRCKLQYDLIGGEPWSNNLIKKDKLDIIYSKCINIKNKDEFLKLSEEEKNICKNFFNNNNIIENQEKVYFCPKTKNKYKNFKSEQIKSCKDNLTYYKNKGLYNNLEYDNLVNYLNKLT